jgi:dTDP-4-dehydrorhamnose reductase
MVVTGHQGQVVSCLIERSQIHSIFDVVALGRPMLDLADTATIERSLVAAKPDIIVSTAAYTAVDQAESEEQLATVINGAAVGKISEAARALRVPLVHISTDYVFDGDKEEPYTELDPVGPIGAYGRSKLAGEFAVAEATQDYAILRTAWVYSPFGKNFVKTILRLAEGRDTINVVADQLGNPTSALDIADGVLSVASNLLSNADPSLRGIFHMAGSGETTWADFAAEILSQSATHGGPTAKVDRISTAEYPTPARRPVNSRLDCSKLSVRHGVLLPNWRTSIAEVVSRLILR